MLESRPNERNNVYNAELTKMKEIIDGLVQVVRGISNTNNPRNDVDKRGMKRSDKKCWYHDNDSHTIDNCFQFGALDHHTRLGGKETFCLFSVFKNWPYWEELYFKNTVFSD